MQNEIAAAQTLLQSDRAELKTIDENMTKVTGEDKAVLVQRRAELNLESNTAQSNLAQLSSTLVTLQQHGTVNYLRIVDPSHIPTTSINPPPISNTLVGIAFGAVVAAAVAFVIEFLNNSIRSPSEITALLKVPLLGSVPSFGNKRSYINKLITWTQPRSNISEAYRAVRVNILFRETNVENAPDCHFYFVTSAGPSEGKTVTIANLAITFAITGMRVLVIDADLRRPAVHTLFGLSNEKGLSDIWGKSEGTLARNRFRATTPSLFNPLMPESLASSVRRSLLHIVQKTEIPNLDVITSGAVPDNPAELLDSLQAHELIHQLSQMRTYDVVFIDTPPTLVVTDSSIVANNTRAKALVVFEAGRTRRGSAVRTIEQLNSLAIPIVGVVLNRVNPRDRDAYYGYEYYYGYSQSSDTKQVLLPGVRGPSANGKYNGTGNAQPQTPVGVDQQQ